MNSLEGTCEMTSSTDHFEGKSTKDHLNQARLKGLIASSEIHGMEMPGHMAAFADTLKDTTLALLVLWASSFTLFPSSTTLPFLVLFSAGWILWKPARSALLGWGRLERLHRLIEEERWEIEHNREQEKAELTEMYAHKGFSGRLLEEVIDVLMSDDNRLLQIMLEEELGLTLEIHEHPLKQACGAAFGALLSSSLLILAFWLAPSFGLPVVAALLILMSAIISAKLERNKGMSVLVWNLAVAGSIAAALYMISKAFILK